MKLSARPGALAASSAGRRGLRVVVRSQMDSTTPGDRLARYLKTPFDVLAFGPRAGFGVLQSLPEQLGGLQQDVQRLMELAQDPRPLTEKQSVVIQEVEERIVGFLDKGIAVETGVLSNVKSVLPAEAVTILNDIIPPAPTRDTMTVDPINTTTSDVYAEPSMGGPSSNGSSSPVYAAAYSSGEDIMTQRIAAEMNEIKMAVSALKGALEGVRTNTDVANTNILRLTLKDARDQLARRLNEVSPITAGDASVASAMREARILLDEVDASFSF